MLPKSSEKSSMVPLPFRSRASQPLRELAGGPTHLKSRRGALDLEFHPSCEVCKVEASPESVDSDW